MIFLLLRTQSGTAQSLSSAIYFTGAQAIAFGSGEADPAISCYSRSDPVNMRNREWGMGDRKKLITQVASYEFRSFRSP
ncbi:MAG TPA: hypothetical protein DD000_01970 [Cyanobacteria bacterium UBA11166]|nr:hypothetical protein [Cyanobacteria bacterium UBA11166]